MPKIAERIYCHSDTSSTQYWSEFHATLIIRCKLQRKCKWKESVANVHYFEAECVLLVSAVYLHACRFFAAPKNTENSLKIWYVSFHPSCSDFHILCCFYTFISIANISFDAWFIWELVQMKSLGYFTKFVSACARLSPFTSKTVVVVWIILNGFQNSPNFHRRSNIVHFDMKLWATATSNCPCQCGQQLSPQFCLHAWQTQFYGFWMAYNRKGEKMNESESNWQHQIKLCNHCSWWAQFSFRV